jgi:hypothetical protein
MTKAMMKQGAALLTLSFWVTILFSASFEISKTIQFYFQNYLFPNFPEFVSLIFLPHGVRVVFTWLYGWRSILPLFFAQSLYGLMLFDPSHVTKLHILSAAFVSSVSVYLACELLRKSGDQVYAYETDQLSWKKLMLIGLIGSVLNGIGNTIVFQSYIPSENHLLTIIGYMIGDTVGTFVALLIMMYSFRLMRGYSSLQEK